MAGISQLRSDIVSIAPVDGGLVSPTEEISLVGSERNGCNSSHNLDWLTDELHALGVDLGDLTVSSTDKDVSVVEKLDGTNVAKDDQGQLYSRRLFIPADAESFLKTSLNHVRYANIKLVKKKLCEKIGLEEHILEKLIVYGELIVNEKYDYKKRKLFSTWLVFGAAINAAEQNLELVSCKLKDGGFVFTIEGRRIRVFANSTFLTLAKECNLDTPVVKGENLSLYEIVLNNKNDMETGKMEGVIITVKDDVSGQHMI